ncbi:hypothetical protein AB0N09_34535 [Streptomyces erythrochromogenes]|uniref:hypothetical protein n=1 Tax=Streptomyces erythrochromogenes TaxID=285574 RepID=UPI00342E417C
MSEPVPEPFWDDTPPWWDPSWIDDGHPAEDMWRLFEGHLDTIDTFVPENDAEAPALEAPATESDRVAAALDATWAALDQLDIGNNSPEETRPWLAQTLLDSAIPHTSSPQPVLDALTDIAASPHGADTWYPTGAAAPNSDQPWQNGPRATHPYPHTPTQPHWQWQGQPGPHPRDTATPRTTHRLPTPPAHSRLLDSRYPDGLALPLPDRELRFDTGALTPAETAILAVIRYTDAADPAEIGAHTLITRRSMRDLAVHFGIQAAHDEAIIVELRALLRGGRLARLHLLPPPDASAPTSHTHLRSPQPQPPAVNTATAPRKRRRDTSDTPSRPALRTAGRRLVLEDDWLLSAVLSDDPVIDLFAAGRVTGHFLGTNTHHMEESIQRLGRKFGIDDTPGQVRRALRDRHRDGTLADPNTYPSARDIASRGSDPDPTGIPTSAEDQWLLDAALSHRPVAGIIRAVEAADSNLPRSQKGMKERIVFLASGLGVPGTCESARRQLRRWRDAGKLTYDGGRWTVGEQQGRRPPTD